MKHGENKVSLCLFSLNVFMDEDPRVYLSIQVGKIKWILVEMWRIKGRV